jgi:hypothetical protein
MIAQCWVNVRFLSVYSTIESTSANDRPRMGERSLPQCFSTLERVLANDRPRMGERLLPQCV